MISFDWPSFFLASCVAMAVVRAPRPDYCKHRDVLMYADSDVLGTSILHK